MQNGSCLFLAVLGSLLAWPMAGHCYEALSQDSSVPHDSVLIAQANTEQEIDRLINSAIELFQAETPESLQQAIPLLEEAQQLAQQLDDAEREYVAVYGLARTYDMLGELQQSLNYYSQALPITRELGLRPEEVQILTALGSIYLQDLEDFQPALDYYAQALDATREIGDRLQESAILNNIGVIQNELGNHQQALDYYRQALPISRELNERDGEANVLKNMGDAFDALGEYQQALGQYNQALPIFKELDDLVSETNTLHDICLITHSLGNQEQALPYCNEALDMLQPFAHLLNDKGDWIRLIEVSSLLQEIHNVLGDQAGEGMALFNIGVANHSLGNLDQALETYNQALSLLQRGEHPPEEAIILGHIGYVYFTLGNQDEALRYYNQALSISREENVQEIEASTLTALGRLYDEMGHLQRALNYYNQGLALSQELGNRVEEAKIINNMGWVYFLLGNQQEAQTRYEEALLINREVGNDSGEAIALKSLGTIYISLGNYETAIDYSNQALSIFRARNDRAQESITLNNIGTAYASMRNWQQALEYFNQALLIQRDMSPASQAVTLGNIGRIYTATGDLQQAMDHLEQTLSIYQESDNYLGQSHTLNQMAGIFWARNEVDYAIEYLEESLQIILSLRSELQQDFRKGFIEQQAQRPTVLLVDFLIQQNQPDRAFEWINRVSTYELADYTRLQGAQVANPNAQAAIDTWNQDFQRLTALRQSLQNPEFTAAAREQQVQQMRDLEAQVNQQADDIATTYPEAAELFEITPEDIATLQASLPVGTVVVQPVLLTNITNLDDSLALFILTRDQPIRVQRVPINGDDVQQLIAEFQEVLQNRNSDTYRTLGGDLYDLVIRPIQADLNELNPQHLAIIATDEWRQIPFEAFWDRDTKTYLIEQYPVHYLTRLSSRSLLAQSQAHFSLPRSPMLLPGLAGILVIVGIGVGRRVNWKLGGLILAGAVAVGGYAGFNPVPRAAVLAFGNPRPEVPFDLPGTEAEVNAIPRYAPNSQIHIRQAATLEQFTQQSPDYAYLHLATHGCFQILGCDLSGDDSSGLDANTLLSEDNTPDLDANTLLFADRSYDLADAALLGLTDTELVVLSACQTAQETDLDQQAIAGLAYLWERAGAKSVMANLWAVEDSATAELIEQFYGGLMDDDLSKAEALQQAKLNLIASKDQYHPLYWAPLLLIGDGR